MHIDELVDHWTILDEERGLVAGKRGATRLAFAILLKFYIQYGRFLRGRSEPPAGSSGSADEVADVGCLQPLLVEFPAGEPADGREGRRDHFLGGRSHVHGDVPIGGHL